MVGKDTNFFKIENNFAKTEQIKSSCIFQASLKYSPKVTIAIPTFKRANLLKETIDSALNQIEYFDYDVIVVDNNPERDCETEKLMISYKDSRLSYYKNEENIQMAGNWNRLFTLAKGEYVVMLHDDDLLLPDFLEVGMRIINNEYDIGALKPKNYRIYDNDKNFDIEKIPILNRNLKRLYDLSFYYGQIIGVPSGIFYKREYVLELGGFNQKFFPNLDFCFMILFSKFYSVYRLNQYLSLYRISKNESFKISTLSGFVKNDYYLIYQLLKSHNIPSFLIKNFLRHRTHNMSVQNNKLWNEDFNFNMNSLNLKKINPLLGRIYHVIIRAYVFILKNRNK